MIQELVSPIEPLIRPSARSVLSVVILSNLNAESGVAPEIPSTMGSEKGNARTDLEIFTKRSSKKEGCQVVIATGNAA